MKSPRRDGFTLLEVIAAVALFAIAVLALTRSGTTSLRNTIDSQKMTQAVQLLQMKMIEMEIKYQKLLDRGGPKAALGEDKGDFDEPYGEFRWSVEVTENPFPLEDETLVGTMTNLGVDSDLAELKIQESAIALNNLRKALEENVVQLYLEVTWDEFGREKKIPLVTHLIPAKPKIRLRLSGG